MAPPRVEWCGSRGTATQGTGTGAAGEWGVVRCAWGGRVATPAQTTHTTTRAGTVNHSSDGEKGVGGGGRWGETAHSVQEQRCVQHCCTGPHRAVSATRQTHAVITNLGGAQATPSWNAHVVGAHDHEVEAAGHHAISSRSAMVLTGGGRASCHAVRFDVGSPSTPVRLAGVPSSKSSGDDGVGNIGGGYRQVHACPSRHTHPPTHPPGSNHAHAWGHWNSNEITHECAAHAHAPHAMPAPVATVVRV